MLPEVFSRVLAVQQHAKHLLQAQACDYRTKNAHALQQVPAIASVVVHDDTRMLLHATPLLDGHRTCAKMSRGKTVGGSDVNSALSVRLADSSSV